MENLLDSYSIEQGWNEASKLNITLEYLQSCVDNNVVPNESDFAAFLAEKQDSENDTD